MRADIPAKAVVATCVIGLGLIAFRSLRLAGVALVLAGGMIRRGRRGATALARDE